MTIKTLGTTYPEIGRIRLGEKVTTKSGKEAPSKLTNLRFTSNDEVALKAIAAQLGGEVVEWNKEQAFELLSESASIDVFLPPDPIDTSYELWGSGGCQRRCDGELCNVPVINDDGGYLEERGCMCLAEGRTPGDKDDRGSCNVTVRLRLVLPYVPGIGIWLCTSHSVYAAMELPGQALLLSSLAEKGRMVPAEFAIDQRTEKKPWEKYKRDYIVPVLRIRDSLYGLSGGGSGMSALTGGAPTQVPDALAGLPEGNTAALAAPKAIDAPAVDSPPKDPPAKDPAAKASAKADGKPHPWHNSIRSAGKRQLDLEGDELDEWVKAKVGKTVGEIAEPDEANKVLAAIKARAAELDAK